MTDTQISEIVNKWEQTRLLEGIKDKESIALCLDTQVKLNESETYSEFPQFKRMTIPILRRLFGVCEAFKRNNFINYNENNKNEVLLFKTRFNYKCENLDQEVEYCATLTENLAKELDVFFRDQLNATITFNGIGVMSDGTIMFNYS